ncbi:MAG: (2Fe-2S)-binding protein [Zoogloeaceae bacterium]|nr:(2Fe-2S)-binding protein [Zoogloeaceae bacterium]
MYVCVCNAVTERHINEAVAQGARHLRDLRSTLGVTVDCGRCARCARDCLKSSLGNCPAERVEEHIESVTYRLAMEA